MVSLALLSAMALVSGTPAMADGIGNAGSDARTGWYPDEAQISPQVVSGGSFGQLWSATVDGQVYAQPLLSNNGTVVVATENDKVYGLNASTGTQQWKTDLGTPWNPGDIGCGDITPAIGTTSTPVIDTSTTPATVYLTFKTYVNSKATWKMAALDVTTGNEKPGFPVTLSGTADNSAGTTFSPATQQQRPGLLLLNGVVYAGFGSHCDYSPYQGWVFGVTTAGQTKARWVDNVSGLDGGGIWQSGGGLSSDASGSILLSTGNGESPSTPTAGSSPPSNLGNSVIRLGVQSNGKLKPVDFFTPFNAANLDEWDTDLGSGAVVVLPSSFGTASVPHTAIAVGKQGEVYLLNRDNLGGAQQGTGQGDAVVQELGPYGAAFGRAGIWPGDGGYAYITTDSGQPSGGLLDVYKSGVNGAGKPTLAHVGSSSDAFGFGSGPVVVTSDHTNSGTALVWVIWAANRYGDGGELRAYDPIPVGGVLQERYHASIGQATNYSMPGVGGGRLYVGTRDGKVLAFGSPVSQPLTGSGPSFPATVIGQSSQKTMTLTANGPLTINSITSSSSQFTIGTASPAVPATLAKGATISVPVTFTPTGSGLQGGQITISTSVGSQTFSESGTGQTAPPLLTADKKLLSFGGISVGGHVSGTITFSNSGAQPLTISAVHLPAAPFSSPDAPAANTVIQPNGSITVDINFDPTTSGSFNDAIGLDSTGGNLSVGLSGSAATPGQLQISPISTDYGNVVVGDSVSKSFTVQNVGGTTVTIAKSKPPFGGEFANATSLNEGSTIQPGQTVTESVTFAPTATGAASGTWQITGDDSTGLHSVQFAGTGVTPLDGSGLTFPTTTIGRSSTKTLTLAANKALNVTGASSNSGAFTVGTATPAIPASLAGGGTISIPVTFSPTAAGSASGQITVTTNAGSQTFSVSGSAVTPGALLLTPTSIDYGSVALTDSATNSFTVKNIGGSVVTITNSTPPSGQGFAAVDPSPLAPGTTLQPGDAAITETVAFAPSAVGASGDVWQITTDAGTYAVQFTGTGTAQRTTSTSTSTTESITRTTTTTTTTTTTSSTSRRPTVHVPAPPKLLPAIVTTTRRSRVYISYAATAVGDAKFTLQRVTSGHLKQVTHGHKVTRSCLPATRAVRRSARCRRYITIATFRHRDRVGNTRIRVTAAVSWRKLVPGVYRLTSVLFDTARLKHTFYATLRINVPPPKHPPKHNRRRR
jgi:hypothetical protein